MGEININELVSKFPKRPLDANKGDAGHVLVIAGSLPYTGSAYLASQAALLSGSGLVTLAAGKSIHPILAAKLTEVMVKIFIETKDGSLSLMAEKDILKFAERCDSFLIGPGVSQNAETQGLVRGLVTKLTKPIVLDADGINAMAGNGELLKKAKAPVILTPHPGEMARLVGKEVPDIQADRKGLALAFANEYNTFLVLKGHDTVVVSPSGDFYINRTGNPGMATGGTGDVLAGMIASFVGQGLGAFEAACLAVYFHGSAGDLAAGEKGVLSLLATDLLRYLPDVLKKLA
ncbi:MAG TPA: NAD(P)H-hydrate dehydratase [Candidatus Omnitrophota bacterium]|nr:NAD(P)H-hydrate dehydratase [Candidatus Omnitrophota bacterium]